MTAPRNVPSWSPIGPPATVSVVIPCYNYARYLGDAVRSALSQDEVNVQVIVVDDASADDSVAVATRLCQGDERVRLIQHHVNRGPAETFNDGLAAATGEFLVRLDADDMLTPGSLKRSVDVARALPEVGLVYGRPVHFRGRPPRPHLTVKRWHVWPGMTWLEDRCADGHNVITSPEVLMRTRMVQALGGQRRLPHTHDMELWLRLATYGDVAYIVGPDQAWHREHPMSLSAREVDAARDIEERLLAFRELRDLSTTKPAVGPLIELAMQTLGTEALGVVLWERRKGRLGNPARVEAMLTFAEETAPVLRESALWSRATTPSQAGGGLPVGAVVEGLIRRWRWRRSRRRWAATGTWSVR